MHTIKKGILLYILILGSASLLLATTPPKLKALKLYPSEIIDTTGTLELENIISSQNSTFYSLGANINSSASTHRISSTLSYGTILYSDKQNWREFNKNKSSITFSKNKDVSKTEAVGLQYTRILGAERKLVPDLFIGAEATLVSAALLYNHVTFSDNDTRQSADFDLNILNSFAIYIKILHK